MGLYVRLDVWGYVGMGVCARMRCMCLVVLKMGVCYTPF